MIYSQFSDLSHSLALQRTSRNVRNELMQAGQEMTTGRRTDLISATGGDLDRVFSIDRSLQLLSQQAYDLTKAQSRAGASQLYLGSVQDATSPFGTDLTAAVARGDLTSARIYADETKQKLGHVVSALNGEYAGRYMFSGDAENTPPIASADLIMSEVEAILAGSADAATALAAIDSFFDDAGGGFETLIYAGSTEDGATVSAPDGDRIEYMTRADAQPIRDVLKGLAIAAAYSETMFAGDTSEMATLFAAAGQEMILGTEGLIDMRANLGSAEGRIAETQAFVSAQKGSLELSRTEIAGVDIFDAAARFADLENQLTAVYTVTARLSNLNLTNFLR